MSAAQAALGDTTAERTDVQSRSRELFREGSAAYEAGDHARAVRALREAWELRQTYDVAGALAQAEIAVGLYRAAAEHLEFCIRHFPPHESEEQLEALRAELERVRSRVGRILLKVSPGAAEVFVDGQSVGRGPVGQPLYVEPGTHKLTVRSGGREVSRTLTSEAGVEQSVELRVPEAPQAAPPAPIQFAAADSAPREHVRPSPVPAIVAASVAGAGLVSGVAFTLLASSRDDDREERLQRLSGASPCGRGRPAANESECREIRELADSVTTFRAMSYVSFGAALAGAVTSVILWPRGNTGQSITVSLLPSVGQGEMLPTASASVTGTF